ncbi:MAG: PIG-L family deacetylase [Candidatus Schekmanbacteria bacterium]|nr:PIG-L family deacetylase [Candidatus Schekmanbacteria bacterium]
MNILAIGAHPDDIEFGCAGTLIKYARQGHHIFLLIMTKGEGGGNAAVRKAEQVKSAQIIVAKEIFWGDYVDTNIPTCKECIQYIEKIAEQVKPDFIFINYFDDTHQDHRNLASCTLSATRYTRNVLFYEGPTTQNFTPTTFVDIEQELEAKLQCLKAHASQVLKTNIESLSIIDLVRASANFRGIQSRTRNAEGFMPLRLFINVMDIGKAL